MSRDGKVRVVVRSRRIPVRTIEVTRSPIIPVGVITATTGILSGPGFHSERAVIYEPVLNEEHRRAIDEGQRLACSLGLELEVVDSGRQGFFGRVLTSLGLDGPGLPTIMVSPSPETDRSGTSQPLIRGR